MLSDGMSMAEVLREYPGITETDILACIAYGAEVARAGYVDLPPEAA